MPEQSMTIALACPARYRDDETAILDLADVAVLQADQRLVE